MLRPHHGATVGALPLCLWLLVTSLVTSGFLYSAGFLHQNVPPVPVLSSLHR